MSSRKLLTERNDSPVEATVKLSFSQHEEHEECLQIQLFKCFLIFAEENVLLISIWLFLIQYLHN